MPDLGTERSLHGRSGLVLTWLVRRLRWLVGMLGWG